MAKDLEYPGDANDLYLARGAEVDARRPLLQGDVFAKVAIPGLDDGPGIAIILTHPCSMRRGPSLVPRQLVARIVDSNPLPLDRWVTSHKRSMPLPALVDDRSRHFMAEFENVGAVSSQALLAAPRIACLDPHGMCLLQQRYVFYMTRLVVPTADLHKVISPVIAESELLEEWVVAADGRGIAVSDAERDFHDFIRTSSEGGGMSLQEALEDPTRRAAVRRAVRQEIRGRFDTVP